jgi:hypothetical protein
MSAARAEGIEVASLGSFFIRGREVQLRDAPLRPRLQRPSAPSAAADPNGEFEVDQVYVQYVTLRRPRARHPLLLWHGGSLSGAVFEGTPDGRPGWQWEFLRAGYDVYVVDAPTSGRAPWPRYPEISPAEPLFRTKQMLWETFRIGAPGSYRSEVAARTALPGTRFPVAAFDDFAMQVVPRFTHADAATAAAMRVTVARLGPCVLITHSAAGVFGYSTAAALPERVIAHAAVEPSGGAPTGTDLRALARVPHLFVWGDGFAGAEPTWEPLVAGARATYEGLAGNATWLDLPAEGITGNSHMLMLDTNSAEIAMRIDGWLSDRGLKG